MSGNMEDTPNYSEMEANSSFEIDGQEGEEETVEIDEEFLEFEFQPYEYVDLCLYCFDSSMKLIETCDFTQNMSFMNGSVYMKIEMNEDNDATE